MASPARSFLPRSEPTASPRQPSALTGDVLEEILLRVASHADLVRASTACVSLRRLIADPNFQHRYRSRHPPRLLGFVGAGREVFQPVEAPHPNAPVARALGRAGGFSFDYVPNSGDPGWAICDVSDGRLLLDGGPVRRSDANSFVWPDLAVCDPVFRQYLLLPRIPEDLLASVKIEGRDIYHFDDSLVPSGDWEETSFRVLRVTESRSRLVVLVFSSTSGCWSVGASISWDVLSFNIPLGPSVLGRTQFAYGCCYWKATCLNKLLKLDMNTVEFSTVDLLPDHKRHSVAVAIVEAGEGNLGMFSLIYDTEVTSVNYCILMQNLSGRDNEWRTKSTTPLPDRCFYSFIGSADGYVFLVRVPSGPEFNNWSHFEYVCFSLEIKTSNIERVSGMGYSACYLYFGFPPSLPARRIPM